MGNAEKQCGWKKQVGAVERQAGAGSPELPGLEQVAFKGQREAGERFMHGVT